MIQYFTILGERCCGTNYVERVISHNFNINYEWTPFKHFHRSPEILNIFGRDDMLVVIVVRNPIDWINSFYQNPHHVIEDNKVSINNFLRNEFPSVYEMGPLKGQIIEIERNMYNGEIYKDIFELRRMKLYFYENDLKNIAKNWVIIRYEDMRDNLMGTLEDLRIRCELKRRIEIYESIGYYKDRMDVRYEDGRTKNVVLREEDIEYIKNRLDLEQEKRFGYLLE